jgi:hypothetical protein
MKTSLAVGRNVEIERDEGSARGEGGRRIGRGVVLHHWQAVAGRDEPLVE